MKILKKTLPFAKINIVRGIVIETLLKFSFADFLFESNSDSVFHWDVFADLCRNFVCKYLLVVLETIKDLKINFKMYLRSSLKYLRSKSFFLLIVHVFSFNESSFFYFFILKVYGKILLQRPSFINHPREKKCGCRVINFFNLKEERGQGINYQKGVSLSRLKEVSLIRFIHFYFVLTWVTKNITSKSIPEVI